MKFGISDPALEQITAVFKSVSAIDKVILFGSRAKGSYKTGSDIDIALIGNNLDISTLSKIDLLLDDLNLPFTFDVLIYTRIENPDLIDHVRRVGVVLYEREQ